MKNNERIIQFYDLDLFGSSLSPSITGKINGYGDINAVMNEIKIIRENNLARKKTPGSSLKEIRLEDFEEKDDVWILLINIVDTSAAHPVTQIIGGNENDRETITLDDTRGLESSTHVIIYKRPNKLGKYLTLYERNSSIPFHKVVSFLNNLFRICSAEVPGRYLLPHPSGQTGKTINIFCRCEGFGHPSTEFLEDLGTGILSDIRLTSDSINLKGFDASTHVELLSNEIKMSVKTNFIRSNGGNRAYIEKAITYADTFDMPYVRVSFKDETGASHTATLSSDTALIANSDLYVRKHKIRDFGNTLKTAFPTIQTRIIDKMLELI